MANALQGRRVAILAADGVEQVELEKPRQAVLDEGATVELVSLDTGEIQAMNGDIDKGDRFAVDRKVADVEIGDFDALLLPGGTMNADSLRMVESAQRFAQAFEAARKPIGVICHGPWLLVSAGLVQGRTLTSWPTLQDDIRNAGGTWVDREVVVDTNWVSSRKPDDLPAFNRELIAALARAPELSANPMPITE